MLPVQLKIAYIGGGSRNWALVLMNDLAQCPDLGGEICLYDIDLESAQLNQALGNWLQDQPGFVSRWTYRAVDTLSETLHGVDFVFISIQPGSLDMMAHEIAVAEKYGLYFPVGDTTGAPGLMRGLRSAIIFAGFAEAIAFHCPSAWVVNYTNPMTICTRTLTRVAPQIKVFGCCHEVFGTQHILADMTAHKLHLAEAPDRANIHVNVLGINHFTWIDRAEYDGLDLLALLREYIEEPGVLRPYEQAEVEAQSNWFTDNRQIKFELFRRFGLLAAAGDRHLAEFVPGFIHTPAELFRWGVIRTPVSYRMQVWQSKPAVIREYLAGTRPYQPFKSGEEAVKQIRAILGMGDVITNVNLPNSGQIANLPIDAVVETNAYFSRNSVRPLSVGLLPPGVHAQISRHVANQEMIIEAALRRDKEMAFQAVFNDPTTQLPLDQAWAMFNEIGLPAGLW